MKKTKIALPLLLLVTFGTLPATGFTQGACKNANVKVTINEHAVWMKPDGGPKCIYAPDLTNVSETFPIALATPGPYQLRDGQVHVRQVPTKFVDDKEIPCGTELEFADEEYTNVGENDIVVTVQGTNVPPGDSLCYEIVVDDVGTIDPRAEVDDISFRLRNVGDELAELINAYDVLIQSGLGDSLAGRSLDAFLLENYGVTEAEARNQVRALQQE